MSEKSIDLVIGGTSGLGLEIATRLSEERPTVVTGRHDPEREVLTFHELDLAAGPELPSRLEALFAELPRVETLVYAAGFYQEGRVDELSVEDIEQMIDVGERGLVYAVREALRRQGELNELITITSTSQWTPREKEPVYNLVKAGAGHFSSAAAQDPRIHKVLVAGPAGMDTPFWDGIDRAGLGEMLDPAWVAEQVMELRSGDYVYNFTQILRDPPRVHTVEQR